MEEGLLFDQNNYFNYFNILEIYQKINGDKNYTRNHIKNKRILIN